MLWLLTVGADTILLLTAGAAILDKRLVERWVKDVLATKADKIMHNAAYDCGWLRASGFTINGRVCDTMLAAPAAR
jgi:DNA polymerase I-like protein with 3'-5' exonuclease and polymerase domains